jgi:hypothetical protein
MRAYTSLNYNVVVLICQDPTYKRMSSDNMFGRIMNHKIYIEKANYIENLYKGVTLTRKEEIALKANKKSKIKQVVVKSSSEKEEDDSFECDTEDMTLFIKKFKKYMKKKVLKRDKKFKSTTKRTCYNCGKYDHFIANCPFERRDDEDNKKNKHYKKD